MDTSGSGHPVAASSGGLQARLSSPSTRPQVLPLPLPPPLPLPLQPLPPPLPGPSPSLPSPTRDPGRCRWAGPPGLSPAPRRAAAAAPFAEEEAPGRGVGRGA